MIKNPIALIVSHTHWDREWYKSYEQTRYRLCEFVRELIDIYQEETNRSPFWLDGQTVIVEDVLDSAPNSDVQSFERLLRDGNILIGPWYTLSDELLVAGESQIRNLLIGRSIMHNYGQANNIGYLPDTFGHISQMPQILRGFGIDNAFLWRGYRKEDINSTEGQWIGADGESVWGGWLLCGYNNAHTLTMDDISSVVKRMKLIVEDIVAKSHTNIVLLLNGRDQTLPAKNLEDVVDALRDGLPNIDWQTGTIKDYLELCRSLEPETNTATIRGEMLYRPQLDGVLSARPSQKRQNRKIENLLIHYAEPLASIVQEIKEYQTYKKQLKSAWKRMCQNHAHDSICGCHSDLVAQDVFHRFAIAEQIAKEVISNSFNSLLGQRPEQTPCTDSQTLVFFNPTCWEWDDIVEAEVMLPADVTPQHITFQYNDVVIQAQLIRERRTNRIVEGKYAKWTEKQPNVRILTFALRIAIPSFGFEYVKVHIEQLDSIDIMEPSNECFSMFSTNNSSRSRIALHPHILNNGKIQVELESNGSFSMTDLHTGMRYDNLNVLTDRYDSGDLYESCYGQNQSTHQAAPGRISLLHDGDVFARSLVQTDIECNTVICPVKMEFTLSDNSEYVDVWLRFDNRSEQHKLTTSFSLPNISSVHVHMPYDLVERQIEQSNLYYDDGRWRSVNSPHQPMHYLLWAHSDDCGLCVSNDGLYEYLWESNDKIDVTLFRAAGVIRDDISGFDASGGNEYGPVEVQYRVGLAMKQKTAVRQGYKLNLRPIQTTCFNSSVIIPQPILKVGHPDWIITSVKPAEEVQGVIVRILNLSDHTTKGDVKVNFKYKEAYLAETCETPKARLPDILQLTSKQIQTLLYVTR